MGTYHVQFDPDDKSIDVSAGTLIAEAARTAGVEIGQPCGGQGRCGRCVVVVNNGIIRRRSTLRLSNEQIDEGYALACQTIIEGDVSISIPPQEKIERKLTTDRTAAEISVPDWFFYERSQTIRRFNLTLEPPTLDDQRDDVSRLLTALRQQHGFTNIHLSLPIIRKLGKILRDGDWQVSTYIYFKELPINDDDQGVLLDVAPGSKLEFDPIWGAAIDIGTTTVTLWLVDLVSGEVKAQVSEYNQQISRGEDVISRIVYSNKENGGNELQNLVLDTINTLIKRACERVDDYSVNPLEIIKATISGNSTMIHLLLGIPPNSIRLSPFITAINEVPVFSTHEIGIMMCESGIIDCLPGVASYVGADITAGVLSAGMDDSEQIILFMDVGTNGEIVLGSRDWLVSCACSAGPAFEGAGVVNGMRATIGAIEEVWINGTTFETTYRVIGRTKPIGICGSGLISLMAELFMTGIIDRGGNLNQNLETERIRERENGLEYVVAWGSETETGLDIVITHVDIDNLIRAKGAIFAGYSVLSESVGIPMEFIEQMLIGGSFGKYINIEKAIQIGLLPDLPWDCFEFLGNTSVRGAYYALIDWRQREKVNDIASRTTYIELSSDNSFYDAFMSSIFLPHTDMSKFPSVAQALQKEEIKEA
jgi:uncharacterized 2Fe-2S/4Fe-4S cluster protein (DUF4445 family)